MAVRPIDANAMLSELRPISFEAEHSAVLLSDVSKMMREWVERQPTLTPSNEWVSVEDAVPDPGERVLVTDGIFVGEAYRSSANSWFRHTGFPWRDGVFRYIKIVNVLFWMPFPEPPTKE